MVSFDLSAANLGKVANFVATSSPLKVVKQTPAAGTPVLEGMTIEVQAISYSSVPYSAIEPTAPPAIGALPISAIEAFISGNPEVKKAVTTSTPADPTTVNTHFSALLGASGAVSLSTTETNIAVGLFKNSFIDR